jgi:hypothetical protein
MDQVVADLREQIQAPFNLAGSVFAEHQVLAVAKGEFLFILALRRSLPQRVGRLDPPPQSAPQNLKWNLGAKTYKSIFPERRAGPNLPEAAEIPGSV